ncbi:MAG: 23S rRNA (uracil(1939)-C(5))-methyltransferase RlmD [Firmicutes bacterium]|nr:23S rRNA (uracil(1939)-C(5))-methyltransferase RlmD [Bacillota bacterium]MCL5039805.1 23S rRNA (uracil(1939)-C(5))-methyltransferase RlmD [Bacillota bacterium]
MKDSSARPPLKVGQEVELVPEGLGEHGEGIARWVENGAAFTVFVEKAIPGDQALVKIVEVKRNYARGETVEILRPSPHRVVPRCQVYYECGGCQLQEMDYAEQLRWKRRQVDDALTRIGGLRDFILHETLRAEEPWFYRNKAVFPVGLAPIPGGHPRDGGTIIAKGRQGSSAEANPLFKGPGRAPVPLLFPKQTTSTGTRGRGTGSAVAGSSYGPRSNPGGLVAGLYARGSHRIIDIDNCPIQHPTNNEILRETRRLIARYGYPPYDEASGQGLIRHVMARTAVATRQAMVGLVINGQKLPGGKELAGELMRRLPAIRSVIANVNTRRSNVIFGDETFLLAGEKAIEDRLGDLTFKLSARSFFQVNPEQAQTLYQKTLGFAGLSGQEVVIDAFTGTGTIALFLARQAGRVIGIEEVPEAVADARGNAVRNGIGNAEFRLGRVEEVLPDLADQGVRPGVVVLDPPRRGVEREALRAIATLRPQRIVYVSCNPATLARDLAILQGCGYRTQEVQPVDMFPQTAHVEAIVLIQRAECQVTTDAVPQDRNLDH